ncbi:MAG: arsenate reductase ArsC [Candidatus Binataceae bacterium]
METIEGERGKPLGLGLWGHRQRKTTTSRRYNVLFLCPDNSAGSIIAEALMKRWGSDSFQAFSAGSRPHTEVHPMAIDILKAQRIWDQNFQPKGCEEFLRQDGPRMDFIISIGNRPPDGSPAQWPGNPRIFHWRISEPVVDGKPAEKSHAFRRTFKELET